MCIIFKVFALNTYSLEEEARFESQTRIVQKHTQTRLIFGDILILCCGISLFAIYSSFIRH